MPNKPDIHKAASVGSKPWATHKKTVKIATLLAQHIVNDIIERKLEPGSKLPPESEMTAEFDVGRGTLREALRLLEVQGVIHIKPGPGGGPVLSALPSIEFAHMMQLHLRIRGASYAEVLEARLAIEPLMARLAATAQNEAGLESLRQLIAAGERVDTHDETAWQELSNEFHAVVASISGNVVLDLLGMSLKEVYHTRTRSAITPIRMRASVIATHRAIAEAILAGNGEEAERLMHEHMAEYAKRSKQLHSKSLDDRIPW